MCIPVGLKNAFKSWNSSWYFYYKIYYIAPEVIGKNYTASCDVWSCGVILYILLCGFPPFNGKTDDEIIEKIKAGNVKFDPKKWSNISEDAKEFIFKMIKLNPDERITT